MGFVAGSECDLDYWSGRKLQTHGGPLETQAPNMPGYGFSKHSGENVMEMVGRKASRPRQGLQLHRLVKMLLDMDENAQQALLVEAQGCRPGSQCHNPKGSSQVAGSLILFAILDAVVRTWR